ncbi:MAG: RNA polymerase sigma factor, partial [Blastocatellia bacterium]
MNAEVSIEDFWPLIPNAVRNAFRHYHHYFNQDEAKDIVQEIALLLLKDDRHVLRSFKGKSSKETWLQSVVNRRVQNSFRGRKNEASLDDATSDDIACPPTQEGEVWVEEMKSLIAKGAGKLTAREQQLGDMILQGLRTEEIARRTGIKPDSVSKSKH